ncbi:DUF2569 domain-containing protein [Paramixta manurensis]|uniref:DUF2569 domain-containing protein n=1 Tax=Paramixta manurensis TaxID=2740817 RepID=A0A6M8UP93_9GAMM|nr:DUF2569 domain-containing protein [Erwiniaceae bacterium PD-1]
MTVSSPAPRIGGWLLLPLAWLIMTLLTSALVMAVYLSALFHPELRQAMTTNPSAFLLQWGLSLATSTVVWLYSAWVTWMFCKRSHRLPRHYIIWLLVTVVLAVKSFAFSPIADSNAIRTLLVSLLAAALLVPYFKRSQRVKTTFIAP